MPKYIRTKDGIYKAVIKDLYGNYYDETETAILVEEQRRFYLLKKDIIAKADTIEELCDGVIEKCWSGNRFHYIWDFDKQEAIKVMNIDINKGYKEFCFGIFVEHNNKIDFISVAKMNEDGELVLI